MSLSVPRWKLAIESAIAKHEKSTVIQLSTIGTSDPPTPTLTSTPVPQVRSHIFRAFLAPSTAPTHTLLVSSTDIRTPKVAQIRTNAHVHIAWWVEGTQEQFRIAGKAYVVPSPEHTGGDSVAAGEDATATATATAAAATVATMTTTTVGVPGLSVHPSPESAITALVKDGFDWERYRVATFRSMSAYMKASWCRPTPGTPLRAVGGEEAVKRWPQRLEEPVAGSTPEERQNWEEALRNFALVLIEPLQVDYVELGIVPNRRTLFWKREDGEWAEEALVP